MQKIITTKLTAGGQTTVPKEVRQALGIADESRVWWRLEDGRAVVSAEAPIPNQVDSSEMFWNGVNRALADAAAGRTRDAGEVSADLRRAYGL